jgi:hypothetical protein
MSQLNMDSMLIQDIDFVDTQDATVVVGGLSIACRPTHGHGDWGGCFPQPRPQPLPHPRPFPIHELPFPRPKPQPWPKHPPIELYAVS